MAPANQTQRDGLSIDGQILEAWGEGWNVGAIIILLLIAFSNYKRRNSLHKLILLEVGPTTLSVSLELLIHGFPFSWSSLWLMEHLFLHL